MKETNQSILALWLASAFSAIGTRMHYFLVAYYLTIETHQAKWAGIVVGAAWIGRSVILLVAGEWIERLGAKRILTLTSLAQILPAILLSILFFLENPSPWFIVGIETIAGALTGLELPARLTLFPSLVSDTRLRQLAMLTHASQTIGFVLGPLVAALGIGRVSYAILFLINAGTFLPVGIASFMSHSRQIIKEEISTRPLRSYFEGFPLLFRVQSLKPHLYLIFLGGALVSPVLSLIAPMSQLAFNGGPWTNMTLTVMYGVGATLSMMAMSSLAHRWKQEVMVQTAMMASLIFALAYVQSSSLWTAMVFIGIFGVMECLAFEGGAVALVQSHLPKENFGRITAAHLALWNLSFALGNILIGYTADAIGIRSALTAAIGVFGILFVRGWMGEKTHRSRR